jgi:hypothetical protein
VLRSSLASNGAQLLAATARQPVISLIVLKKSLTAIAVLGGTIVNERYLHATMRQVVKGRSQEAWSY